MRTKKRILFHEDEEAKTKKKRTKTDERRMLLEFSLRNGVKIS